MNRNQPPSYISPVFGGEREGASSDNERVCKICASCETSSDK